ncbi:MAG: arsenic transporter [Acidobacteriota bacterium]|nr:arsenic transporter [Acidobacteriota bacterium]
MSHAFTWSIAAITILLILVRPKRIPEAVWACSGAGLLVLLQLIPFGKALAAVARGTDVYLFLTGMMLLAELARREGFFDWLAAIAVKSARGSRKRLFTLVYLVGIGVTTFLSNDATAVVLTPAVLAAVKKARATPLPYLLICAFIANAASFVLPISNPANLVVYASKMPPLLTWLRFFALPSGLSIVATYIVLRLTSGKDLKGEMESNVDRPALSSAGRRAAYGIVGTGFALILASAFNVDLGLPTFLAALAATVLVTFEDHDAPLSIVKDVSWSVLPLVAGLFVLVEALNGAGALTMSRTALQQSAAATPLIGALASAFGVAFLSNVMNNLPVGLITGGAIHATKVPELIRNALLIGVDLGPNLSVTGSLATILWLVALRREGEEVGFWKFLRYGALVMPPALILAILALLVTTR